MKKIPQVAALALTVLWLGILAASVVTRCQAVDAWDAMVYNVFILLGAMGAVSALLFALALPSSQKSGRKAALWAAGTTNALFALFAALLFPVNRDWLAILLPLWLLSALTTLALLLANKKRGPSPQIKSVQPPGSRQGQGAQPPQGQGAQPPSGARGAAPCDRALP